MSHSDERERGQQRERGAPARIRWHPLDPVSLVAGVLAVGWALMALLDVDLDGAVVLPVLLVVAGLAGLASAVRRDRSSG